MSEITIDQIDQAIADLAQGKRKVRLTMGDKSIEYSDATIDQLRQLRADIMAGNYSTAGTKRFVRFGSCKGL